MKHLILILIGLVFIGTYEGQHVYVDKNEVTGIVWNDLCGRTEIYLKYSERTVYSELKPEQVYKLLEAEN